MNRSLEMTLSVFIVLSGVGFFLYRLSAFRHARRERLIQRPLITKSVEQGEQVRTLTPARARNLAAKVRPGYRAIIVAIEVASSLYPVLKPDDRVDVIATFNSRFSNTIAQNVRVLGIDLDSNTGPAYRRPAETETSAGVASAEELERGQWGSIVLEVTPEDAVRIILSKAAGEVKYTLRQRTTTTNEPQNS